MRISDDNIIFYKLMRRLQKKDSVPTNNSMHEAMKAKNEITQTHNLKTTYDYNTQ